MPLDLHVLSLPLAFILSQDQTLHCNIYFLKFPLKINPVFLLIRNQLGVFLKRVSFSRLVLLHSISQRTSFLLFPLIWDDKINASCSTLQIFLQIFFSARLPLPRNRSPSQEAINLISELNQSKSGCKYRGIFLIDKPIHKKKEWIFFHSYSSACQWAHYFLNFFLPTPPLLYLLWVLTIP